MSLGFKMAGFSSIFASDVDENAGKTFKRNFPNTPFKVKDICQITKEEVDEMTGGITPDVIIGGPPCQGFSLANKRRNRIKDDPRNRLFYQFVKFIDWYSPKAFVMENVPNILSIGGGAVKEAILNDFENLGYTQQWREAMSGLTDEERKELYPIIFKNDFNHIDELTENVKFRHILTFYKNYRGEIADHNSELYKLKQEFDKRQKSV